MGHMQQKYRQCPPPASGVAAPSEIPLQTPGPLPKAVDALRTCAAGVRGVGVW